MRVIMFLQEQKNGQRLWDPTTESGLKRVEFIQRPTLKRDFSLETAQNAMLSEGSQDTGRSITKWKSRFGEVRVDQ